LACQTTWHLAAVCLQPTQAPCAAQCWHLSAGSA
jgi:hypothetical protein